MSQNEERIGRKGGTGVTVWPALSISNRNYSRPCTMVGLGNGYFCVKDNFPMDGYKAEIDKLKAVVAGMNEPPKPKRKVTDVS